MRLFLRFDELCGDAQAIAVAPNVAFDQVIGAQRAADFGRAAPLALRALDRRARNDANMCAGSIWASCVMASSVRPSVNPSPGPNGSDRESRARPHDVRDGRG